MNKSAKRPVHTGSTFDEFLESEGTRGEVESAAMKRVLAWQFQQEMKRQQKTKQALARELETSRSQLDRLLDPENTSVSLESLNRAAHALGKEIVFHMTDRRPIARAAKSLLSHRKAAARKRPRSVVA